MQRGKRWSASSKLGATVVLGGVAYAVGASFTQPFTIGADLVTALPLGLAAVLFGVGLSSASRSRRRATEPGGSGGPAEEGCPAASPRLQTKRVGWLVWPALAGAVVGWELLVYSQSPRPAHPTLSSLIDMADASQVGKTLLFGLWLLLGSFLLRP